VRVAWSGHRPELFARPDQARQVVEQETGRLAAQYGGELVVLSGGQRGVDLWAASAARTHSLRLELLLPTPVAAFSAHWLPDDAVELAEAAEYASTVRVFGADAADPSSYEARNQALAAECDLLVVIWTGLEQGGTFFTLTKARALGKEIREHRLEPSGYQPQVGERGL
jgi:uncharacterized phage-like protein YoqJ